MSQEHLVSDTMAFSSTPGSRWTGISPDYSDDLMAADNKAEISSIHSIAYGIVANIIVGVGIFGNILNVIVLTRPKLKGVMYVYLLGLAVSNLCVLVSAIPALMALERGKNTRHYAVAFFEAHLALPLLNSFMASSVYIIICTTVNRYISIYMPTHFQRIHTYKNAYLAIGCSFVGGILAHIPLCFDHKVVSCSDPENMTINTVKGNANPPINCIYTSVDNRELSAHPLFRVYIGISETLLRLGPIVTLTILNIMIIVKFYRIAKKRQVLRGTASHRGSNGNAGPMASSTMLPPPAAVLAARANENGNGTWIAGNYTSTLLSVNEHNNYKLSQSVAPSHHESKEEQDPMIKANGSASLETAGADSAPGSNDSAHGSGLPSSNGSANSSRRESPPQNQTFHHLLVTTRPRTSSSNSRGVYAQTSSVRNTPHRVSTRRRGLHNPEERMLVVVLIAIVVLFVICTTPAAILSILYLNKSLIDTVGFTQFRACANNLELLGFALNFFVYCLCSAEIRRAFVDVLFENWIVQMARERLTLSKGSPPQVQVDLELVDLVHQEDGLTRVRPVVGSINISTTPNMSCLHHNDIMVGSNIHNHTSDCNGDAAVSTYVTEGGKTLSATPQ